MWIRLGSEAEGSVRTQFLTRTNLRAMERTIAPEYQKGFRALELSAQVIAFYLGPEWIEIYLNQTRTKRGYFNLGTSKVDLETKYARAMDLAEALYNFQYIPGFLPRIDTFKTDSTEGLFGEMEAAKILHIYKYLFEFVNSSERDRKVHEFNLRWNDGTWFGLEVKSKEESTEFSSNTVTRVLREAASQLPIAKPGIIFLQIPLNWSSDDDPNSATRMAQLRDMVKGFYPGQYGAKPADHIGSVAIFTKKIKIINKKRFYGFGGFDIYNDLTCYPREDMYRFFDRPMQPLPLHWIRMLDITDPSHRPLRWKGLIV